MKTTIEWISVEDRFPEINRTVLAVHETPDHQRSVTMGSYTGKKTYPWEDDCGYYLLTGRVTHWAELPEIPND